MPPIHRYKTAETAASQLLASSLLCMSTMACSGNAISTTSHSPVPLPQDVLELLAAEAHTPPEIVDSVQSPTKQSVRQEISQARSSVLSDEERDKLENHFVANDISMPTIDGRLLTWSDTAWMADTVLQQIALAQAPRLKGFSNTARPSSNFDLINFYRPDITSNSFIIVPDGPATQRLFDALADVAQDWSNATTEDVLTSEEFVVVRQSEYDALSPIFKALSYEIFVDWLPKSSSDWACDGDNGGVNGQGAVACAVNSISLQSVLRGGDNITRYAFGNYMQFSSSDDRLNSDTNLRNTARHEIGHLIGLGHDDPINNGRVPGTEICDPICPSGYISQMANGGNRVNFITPDDILTLKTLYGIHPDRDNDEFDYVHGPRALSAWPGN